MVLGGIRRYYYQAVLLLFGIIIRRYKAVLGCFIFSSLKLSSLNYYKL